MNFDRKTAYNLYHLFHAKMHAHSTLYSPFRVICNNLHTSTQQTANTWTN